MILLQNKVLKEVTNYNKSKFIHTRTLFNLSCKYTKLSLGLNWILLLRCGYKYNATISFRSGRITENGHKCCLCCDKGDKSVEYLKFLPFQMLDWND